MGYDLSISNKAKKDIRKIDAKMQKRIKATVQEIASMLPTRHPNWGPLEPASYPAQRFNADGRVKVGKYRILTTILDRDNTVVIPRVFIRGDPQYGFSESEAPSDDKVEADAQSAEDEESDAEGETPNPVSEQDTRSVIRSILLGEEDLDV